jgi:transcriptional regulator with XRE-family HTH domain
MNKELGQRIRQLRENAHLTQECIAEKLGISRQKYSRIENGTNDISYDLILRVASVIGVTPGSITSAADKMEASSVEFRSANNDVRSFDTISEMLDLFYANKQLYESVRIGEE